MFYNRESQLSKLNGLFDLNKSSIAVCRGRRRIGKSTLIKQFAKNAVNFINIQGLSPATYKGKLPPSHILLRDQLNNFDAQLSLHTKLPLMKPTSWLQALTFLNNAIKNEPTVVLLDEISWMSLGDVNFAGTLKIVWDTQLSDNSKLVLVLCGSVSSWISENILKGTGFRGRVSLSFDLNQLDLYHSSMFWENALGNISSFEKFKILSITGGVPKYLEEIDFKKSAEQNIHRLCFQSDGYLFKEYKQVFHDTFGSRSDTYQKIVEKLSKGHQSADDICHYLGWKRGGTVARYLKDLTESGFITSYQSKHPGRKATTRNIRYRLTDNYLRFYLKYIQKRISAINNNTLKKIDINHLPGWDILMGFQFENLVLNNWESVCKIIGISPSSIIWVGPYFRKGTKIAKGCQIDLLIETKYTLYICEIRFRKKIRKSIIKEMQNKIKVLGAPQYLSIRPVLIYIGDIGDDIVMADYFSNYINFEQLLCESILDL